jgi:glycosyltransferase involved in cell wall biosynthesis
MKILMVVSRFFPAGVGGAERQCWRQARALARRGHEVMIVTKWLDPDSARSEDVDGVRIFRRGCFFSLRKALRRHVARTLPDNPGTGKVRPLDLPGGMPPSRSRWQSISEWARNFLFMADVAWGVANGRIKADVVHVHESHWIAGFAQWIGERMGAPVFCKEATQPVLVFADMPDVPWVTKWESRRMNCRFIAMTDGIARELAAAGIPEPCIARVPNGVEVPDEVAEPGRHTDALYVGNFTQGAGFKGFDVLFQAWALVHRQAPDMKLRLYGRGDTGTWTAYANECGCGNSVVFEGETHDIWAVHRQSGLFVLPSRQEGLSNALLEAMASGLPAVVSDIPGNTAAVRNGVEGIVVPVNDAEALAAAILKLLRSAELRAQLGRAARARVEASFAIGKVAERLEAAYRAAIEDGTP